MKRLLTVACLAILLAGCEPAAPKAISGKVAAVHAPSTTQPAAETQAEAKQFAADPIAYVQAGRAWYDQHVKDYTCTLYKKERIDPKAADFLSEQKMLCKFKENPFSVFTDTVVNPRGADRALYVETVGQKDWKMKARAKVLGLPVTAEVDPRGPEARQHTLRFVDQFGFKRSLEQIIKTLKVVQAEAKTAGKGGAASQISFKQVGKVGDRDVLIFEYWLKEAAPTGQFEFPHGRIYLDREWRLPLGVDLYDAKDIERAEYRFTDIKFNTGLTDADFTTKKNGM